MIACGIETSGSVGSVALVDEARVLAEVTFEKGLRHGQAIMPSLEACLAAAGIGRSAIDLFVVGTGPGSYTGLRVGIMTGRALAFALGRPLAGVPSFDALAADLGAEALGDAASLAVATDARRERIYMGAYALPERRRLGAFEVRAAAHLLDGVAPPVVLAGSGLEGYPELVARTRFVEAHAPARAVARLGLAGYRTGAPGRPEDVKPLYLRAGLAQEDA